MSEISKTYEPASIEEKWYAHWLADGCFTADPARVSATRPAYSIVIPPPNVTGVLTLGHVLNNTIQDILARRARMLGKEVLWLPGTDHAGIATQNVVERTLRKAGEIKHRDDLGREALVGKIWEWKEKYGGIIIQQLKKLGASCDWSRERFTMDPEYSRCVTRVFVDLYKKGLIYRGKRMVNWCPVSLTALSDEEVEMKPQNGTMYYFKVEVAEQRGMSLTIATTRPETIPGDTAVAVNPADPRYGHLIGQHVIRPLPVQLPEAEKLIPIIGDDSIEVGFGTGVLKVTPAHDKADFEIMARWNAQRSAAGEKHPLIEAVTIMDPDGTMNALAGESLAGLDRFEARVLAAERLRELGQLVKEEPYQNNVGYSERAQVPIEPRLSEQWFLKYPSQAESRRVVTDGPMRFHPERWAKVYDHWMGNLQDWCISRQLWWGHRVPVWYRDEEIHCGLQAPEGEGWRQDPDVLDTWFSSWLWPFATMGWPEETGTLQKFYPTDDLVTGPDIIFFWVARMIMAGFEYRGELPFKNVYFTGIIRDKQGRKMSKSLGNSPDPLDLIAQYGADALRFGVMRGAPLGADILFDEKNVELGRNFCTKLWNAARFRQMQTGAPVASAFDGDATTAPVGTDPSFEAEIVPGLLTSDDKWILLRLDAAVREITVALEEYRFSDAAQAIYRFFWSEYCDWYLEAAKASLQGSDPARRSNTLAVMDYVLGQTLRLMHPFLPFITEELWNGMGFNLDLPAQQGGSTIMFAPWPKPLSDEERAWFVLDESDERLAAAKYEVVNLGRSLRRDFNIASNKRVRFVLRPAATLEPHDRSVLQVLLNADPLELADAAWMAPKGTPTALTPLGELFLPLEGLVDPAAERQRLTKEMNKAADELTRVRSKLSNPSFAEKVPSSVLEEHRQRELAWGEKLAQLERMLAALG